MKKSAIASESVIPDTTDQCLRRLGLTQNPFSMAPDIVNFYSPTRVETIIVEVLQLIDTRMGFALLYGDVGLGKTTLCRRILFELDRRDDVQTALVFNTFYQEVELLREINRDFGVSAPDASLQGQMSALNAFLLEQRSQGRNCVIIIDDAQSLTVESLELVRQISNMETGIDKIVQIILIGQPELEEKLNLHELRQLKSRIVLKREFRPYTLQETATYVRTKIARSGDRVRLEVADAAVRCVHEASQGIPRRINVIMGRCLYAAVAHNTHIVSREIARSAIQDVEESLDAVESPRIPRRVLVALAASLLVALPLALFAMGYFGVVSLDGWRDGSKEAAVSAPELPVAPEAARTAAVALDTLPAGARASRHPEVPVAPAGVDIAAGDEPEAAPRNELPPAGTPHDGFEAYTAPREDVVTVTSLHPETVPVTLDDAGGDAAAARMTEVVGTSPSDLDPAVYGFLDAYGLTMFAAPFEAALRAGGLNDVARDINEKTGLRLVALPAVVADVKDRYTTLQVPDRVNDSTNYLLFWQPREWPADNFAVYYDQQAVKALQTALSRFGAYQYFIDGVAGHRTTAALKLFQRAVGLVETGAPDVETLFMLEFLNPERRAAVAQSDTDADNNWTLRQVGTQ